MKKCLCTFFIQIFKQRSYKTISYNATYYNDADKKKSFILLNLTYCNVHNFFFKHSKFVSIFSPLMLLIYEDTRVICSHWVKRITKFISFENSKETFGITNIGQLYNIKNKYNGKTYTRKKSRNNWEV